MLVRTWIGWFAIGAIAGCSASVDEGTACPGATLGTTQSALINGSAGETYLGLGARQIQAIVQIVDASLWNVDASLPSGGLCTGTFIAPSWVITARHCLSIEHPAVVIQVEGGSPTVVPSLMTVANPSEDVALLNVDLSSVDAGAALSGLEPMAFGGSGLVTIGTESVVELAGYGLTQTDTVGTLRFLLEPIVGMDDTTITVDGFGANGACEGDSGGPLLARSMDGAPIVVGVLSDGSATCLETDSYTRLDSVLAWVQQYVGPYVANHTDCGTISGTGRCLYGSSLRCSGTQLVTENCSGGLECGWNAAQAAFLCVNPASDPCEGVDSVGACRGGQALRCDAGALLKQVCAPCMTCGIEGTTGSPSCVSGSASIDGG